MESCSRDDSHIQDSPKKSEADTYLDRTSSMVLETSELAILTSLEETMARDLDSEKHQNTYGDLNLSSSGLTLDNVADALKVIVVSIHPMSFSPQNPAVRIDLEPLELEIDYLIFLFWFVKMED